MNELLSLEDEGGSRILEVFTQSIQQPEAVRSAKNTVPPVKQPAPCTSPSPRAVDLTKTRGCAGRYCWAQMLPC